MTVAEAIKTGKAMLTDGSFLPPSDQLSGIVPSADFVLSPSPALDINCILEHILQKDRTFLLIHRDLELSKAQETAFLEAVAKRRTGLPVAYITGHKEFYGLDFYVTSDVLIPKPDTELLVEHAVDWAKDFLRENPPEISIADICTGSGCIIISVLHELIGSNGFTGLSKLNAPRSSQDIMPQINACASDISKPALKIAATNASRLLPDTEITFLQGDLFKPFPEDKHFDLILSNPPYIPSAMVKELLKDGRSEPVLALDGDALLSETVRSADTTGDGLAIIRRLIPQAFEHLNTGGVFLIESGEYNAEATAELMKKAGFCNVRIFEDLAGQLRLTQGRK
ncbi:MAG: peptide chain release factor N(5)-glutamine methyltransferase [Treponema sp.]|nr:peptide chain release factor N(5)-glutamine methyltransferase [Treponema sp.]